MSVPSADSAISKGTLRPMPKGLVRCNPPGGFDDPCTQRLVSMLARFPPLKGFPVAEPVGMLTVKALTESVAADAIDTVIVGFTDHQGQFLGKRIDAGFFLEEVAEDGTHGCDYLLTTDMEMEPIPGYSYANWELGYGDFHLTPDLSTMRIADWLPGTALVLSDLRDTHVPTNSSPSLQDQYSADRSTGQQNQDSLRKPPQNLSTSSLRIPIARRPNATTRDSPRSAGTRRTTTCSRGPERSSSTGQRAAPSSAPVSPSRHRRAKRAWVSMNSISATRTF